MGFDLLLRWIDFDGRIPDEGDITENTGIDGRELTGMVRRFKNRLRRHLPDYMTHA